MKIAAHGQEAAPLAENEVRMSLDEQGFAKLMGTLAGLYVNPPLSVLREYTSNAFDSHVKAGIERPIEVKYSQDRFGPFELSIEDFGVGMDLDDLKNIYSKYGASTKESANREIGGFGLGAKSALSIASTFTVRARKNGAEVTATISKGRDGVGVFSFSPITATKKSNGVLVRIPINAGHRDEIKTAVGFRDFFIGAKQESVRVNGEFVSTVRGRKNYLQVSVGTEPLAWAMNYSDFKLTTTGKKISHWASSVTFLVGGVRYPAEATMFENVHLDDSTWWSKIANRLSYLLADNHRLYVNLPIGGIDLAPNREKIQLTDRSATTIRATFESLFDLMPKAFSAAANKIKDQDEAFDFIAQNWRMFVAPNRSFPPEVGESFVASSILSGEDFAWRGRNIPNFMPAPYGGYTVVNAATGVSIYHAKIDESTIDTLGDFAKMRLRKEPSKRIIVTTPGDPSEQHIKTVRALIRTYGDARWGQTSIFAYVLPEGSLNATLSAAYHVVKVDNLDQIARDHKRAQRAGIEKVIKPVVFPLVCKSSATEVMAVLVPASDARLATTTFFSVHDARVKNVKRSFVHLAFSNLREDDPKKLTTGYAMQIAPKNLREYLGSDVFMVGSNRNIKVIEKHFDPANNLLWHVYRDAEARLAKIGPAKLAALLDAGFMLSGVADYMYYNDNPRTNKHTYKVMFTLLAQHSNALRSERLRHALEYMAEGSSDDLTFAKVAGMIDWTRFRQQAIASNLDSTLLDCLTDQGHSRMHSWFNAVQKVKPDNAADIAFLLDALATHHHWA